MELQVGLGVVNSPIRKFIFHKDLHSAFFLFVFFQIFLFKFQTVNLVFAMY